MKFFRSLHPNDSVAVFVFAPCLILYMRAAGFALFLHHGNWLLDSSDFTAESYWPLLSKHIPAASSAVAHHKELPMWEASWLQINASNLERSALVTSNRDSSTKPPFVSSGCSKLATESTHCHSPPLLWRMAAYLLETMQDLKGTNQISHLTQRDGQYGCL